MKYVAGLCIALGVIGLFAIMVITHGRHHSTYATTGLTVGTKQLTLQIADSPQKQTLGLGNRTTMSSDKGMLFPYAQPQQLCFWMKDMHFPLDIIWLDSAKRVTLIEPDLTPQTYPQSYCADNAQYVIELNAGQATSIGLKTGQKLTF